MQSFIELWPSIEVGFRPVIINSTPELSKKRPSLWLRGKIWIYQAKLAALIDELKQINKSSQYSYWDVSLIVLREGLEAMLIVLALVASLRNRSGQTPSYV